MLFIKTTISHRYGNSCLRVRSFACLRGCRRVPACTRAFARLSWKGLNFKTHRYIEELLAGKCKSIDSETICYICLKKFEMNSISLVIIQYKQKLKAWIIIACTVFLDSDWFLRVQLIVNCTLENNDCTAWSSEEFSNAKFLRQCNDLITERDFLFHIVAYVFLVQSMYSRYIQWLTSNRMELIRSIND